MLEQYLFFTLYSWNRSKAWWWPRRWSNPWPLKLRLRGKYTLTIKKTKNIFTKTTKKGYPKFLAK